MALQSTETRGIFSAFGALNDTHIPMWYRPMHRFIDASNPVTLHLESVKGMNTTAAFVLQNSYQNAVRSNSLLFSIKWVNTNSITVSNKTGTSYSDSDDSI